MEGRAARRGEGAASRTHSALLPHTNLSHTQCAHMRPAPSRGRCAVLKRALGEVEAALVASCRWGAGSLADVRQRLGLAPLQTWAAAS